MKALVLAAVALASLPATHAAAQADRWTTWRNDRFAFSICDPADLFPNSRESPQGHGITMESRDSAQLIAAAIRTRPGRWPSRSAWNGSG